MTDAEKTKKLLTIANDYPGVKTPCIAALEAHRREGLIIAASGVTKDEKLIRIEWLETQTYLRILRVLKSHGIQVPAALLEEGEERRLC